MSERIDMWRAPDGRTFSTEQSCLEYEQQVADADAANAALEGGASLLAVLQLANRSRSWWRADDADAALLSSMTKDTALVVRHWQCSDKPGYKFCRVDYEGRIRLYGDAGSWSGSYGNWVSLEDFIRYARATPGVWPVATAGNAA
jgi:hypothetical protein